MASGPEEIARAVRTLRGGGVVAFPTETVYGLGASALDQSAVARVFALKGRPSNNPLIVHVTGAEMARRVVLAWSPEAEALTRAFWPGPLSLVLARGPALPALVTSGAPGVAVRCPDHPLTLALISAFDGPLVGPSANLSGRVSPTTAAHVREAFPAGEVDVLDGGACRGGIESTVLSLMGPEPVILRPGLIGAAELSRVLGRPVATPEPRFAEANTAEPAPSPGMFTLHYAPATPAVWFRSERWRELEMLARSATRPIVLVTHEERLLPPPHVVIPMPRDPFRYAQRLYAALREADVVGGALIAVEKPPAGSEADPELANVWRAVADRLARATRPLA